MNSFVFFVIVIFVIAIISILIYIDKIKKFVKTDDAKDIALFILSVLIIGAFLFVISPSASGGEYFKWTEIEAGLD